MKATEANDSRKLSGPLWPLLLGIILPTFVTWIYFDALSEQKSSLQQIAYVLGKVVQFTLPVIAFWIRPKPQIEIVPKFGASAIAGILFGLLVASAMIAIYLLVLIPNHVMDGPREQALAKVKEIGIASAASLIAVGVFYSLFHSAMEEYYWRWFVFRELELRMALMPAAVIGGLGFMAHHVLVLARYFGWDSPLTWLFSFGIAVGGAAWALIYKKWGTLLGPWLSHLLVDAAIFIIGYHLLFRYSP
jgi:membrane protease YdiL (CAAX protease family)